MIALCETCRWWDNRPGHAEHKYDGICRKGSPQVMEVTYPEQASRGFVYGGWPIVESDDWCGGHDLGPRKCPACSVPAKSAAQVCCDACAEELP